MRMRVVSEAVTNASGRLRLHPEDNVEVSIGADDELRGHKFALADIAVGDAIIKLGEQKSHGRRGQFYKM